MGGHTPGTQKSWTRSISRCLIWFPVNCRSQGCGAAGTLRSPPMSSLSIALQMMPEKTAITGTTTAAYAIPASSLKRLEAEVPKMVKIG